MKLSSRIFVGIAIFLAVSLVGVAIFGLVVYKNNAKGSWNAVELDIEKSEIYPRTNRYMAKDFNLEVVVRFEVVIKNNSSKTITLAKGCSHPNFLPEMEVYRIGDSSGTASGLSPRNQPIIDVCSDPEDRIIRPGKKRTKIVQSSSFVFSGKCESFYIVFSAKFDGKDVEKITDIIEVCHDDSDIEYENEGSNFGPPGIKSR